MFSYLSKLLLCSFLDLKVTPILENVSYIVFVNNRIVTWNKLTLRTYNWRSSCFTFNTRFKIGADLNTTSIWKTWLLLTVHPGCLLTFGLNYFQLVMFCYTRASVVSQSDGGRRKPITTWCHAFSRAWCRLRAFVEFSLVRCVVVLFSDWLRDCIKTRTKFTWLLSVSRQKFQRLLEENKLYHWTTTAAKTKHKQERTLSACILSMDKFLSALFVVSLPSQYYEMILLNSISFTSQFSKDDRGKETRPLKNNNSSKNETQNSIHHCARVFPFGEFLKNAHQVDAGKQVSPTAGFLISIFLWKKNCSIVKLK